MEQCAGGMMMHENWDRPAHDDGRARRFHGDYMHDPEHRYRLRADGMNPDGMCDLDGGIEENVTLTVQISRYSCQE
jgi:hypothetical protein